MCYISVFIRVTWFMFLKKQSPHKGFYIDGWVFGLYLGSTVCKGVWLMMV